MDGKITKKKYSKKQEDGVKKLHSIFTVQNQ